VSKGQFDPSLERFKGSKLRRSDNICKTKKKCLAFDQTSVDHGSP